MPRRKPKHNAETARFGHVSTRALEQDVIDLTVAWACAVENHGSKSSEAKGVLAEWKDAAEQMYLRALPMDVDENDEAVPRPTPELGPLQDFVRVKRNRTRRKPNTE